MLSQVLVALALNSVAQANLIRVGLFTPLKNDEHPCVAENLKARKKLFVIDFQYYYLA